MIIKATLATLVVILLVVIATSYYVNKEGFDNLSNPPPLPSIKSQVESFNRNMNTIINNNMDINAPTCSCEISNPTKAYMFDTLHKIGRQDLNDISKKLTELLLTESTNQELAIFLDNSRTELGKLQDNISPFQELKFKFNDPDLNLLFRQAVRTALVNTNKVMELYKIKITGNGLNNSLSRSPNATDDDKKLVQDALTSLQNNLKAAIDNMNNSINKLNAIKFIEPNTSATSTTGSTTTPPSTTPSRTDVVPEVKFSENGYNALMLQQKADILKDLQKVVRNEVLANRSTTPMLHNDGCGLEDDKHGCEPVKEHGCDNEDVPKNECDAKPLKDKVTAATSQGKEYENSCYKDKTARASCPPQPDMAQFIKKDAIPCWGCALDY